MRKNLFYFGKITLSVAIIPLWFLKMFVGVGHLPDEKNGEIAEVIFRHSMLENISAVAHPALAYVAIAVALVSALVNIFSWRHHGNAIAKVVGNLVFGIAIGFFLLLSVMASTVTRGY